MSIRVRFAPSPTGHIHVGNLRTALFNYLFAKNQNGQTILRIEDTDTVRSTLESEELIYKDLDWVGLEFDESPLFEGDYSPYRQSDRLDIYKKYADKLLEDGFAYYCFCSKEELDAEREKAAKESRPPLYNLKCANTSLDEAKKRIANGEKPAIRFRAFKENIIVKDIIHGDIDFPTNSFGDFIIVRPDDMPIYNYVVVVDDALMKISHVIRGDDHLSNTPKQALIFEALGFETPIFAHIPMIVGDDHAKLSKRHGTTSVEQFRDNGYLPEALINYLALLSWSSDDGKEVFSIDELIERFSIKRVSKSAAVFDFDKLNWMNGQHIRLLDSDRLFKECLPYMKSIELLTDEFIEQNIYRLKECLLSVKDSLVTIKDVTQNISVYFKQPDDITSAAKEILELESTKPVLENFIQLIGDDEYLTIDRYKSIMKEIQTTIGVKGKPLYMAVRVGISKSTEGPELDSLTTLIPVKCIKKRIEKVLLIKK